MANQEDGQGQPAMGIGARGWLAWLVRSIQKSKAGETKYGRSHKMDCTERARLQKKRANTQKGCFPTARVRLQRSQPNLDLSKLKSIDLALGRTLMLRMARWRWKMTSVQSTRHLVSTRGRQLIMSSSKVSSTAARMGRLYRSSSTATNSSAATHR